VNPSLVFDSARHPELSAAPHLLRPSCPAAAGPPHRPPPRMEMAPATISANPRTVEEIFKDFSARRAGLVRALTSGNNRSPPSSRLTCSPCMDLTPRSPLASSPVQKWRISTATATQVSEIDPPRAVPGCVWIRGGTERIGDLFACVQIRRICACTASPTGPGRWRRRRRRCRPRFRSRRWGSTSPATACSAATGSP
jgi:hypothetical protein